MGGRHQRLFPQLPIQLVLKLTLPPFPHLPRVSCPVFHLFVFPPLLRLFFPSKSSRQRLTGPPTATACNRALYVFLSFFLRSYHPLDQSYFFFFSFRTPICKSSPSRSQVNPTSYSFKLFLSDFFPLPPEVLFPPPPLPPQQESPSRDDDPSLLYILVIKPFRTPRSLSFFLPFPNFRPLLAITRDPLTSPPLTMPPEGLPHRFPPLD